MSAEPRQSSLEALIVRYLVCRERGDDVLEELCRAHPHHSQALRARAATIGKLRAVFAKVRSPTASEVPASIGRFKLLTEIGRGGMGVVYLAHDPMHDRRVALKRLAPDAVVAGSGMARFAREAAAIARLRHPSIAAIHEVGMIAEVPFFTMEYVPGCTAAQILRGLREAGCPPAYITAEAFVAAAGITSRPALRTEGINGYVRAMADLVSQLAVALHHAHTHGIVHRDVKPSNVMVREDGRPVLIDFGLARLLDLVGLTRSSDFLGTPEYCAPEQLEGGRTPTDARTDVYALGLMLYELLTLEHPFRSPREHAVAKARLDRRAAPPSALNAKVAPELDRICATAMQSAASERYQSAGEMADALQRFLAMS